MLLEEISFPPVTKVATENETCENRCPSHVFFRCCMRSAFYFFLIFDVVCPMDLVALCISFIVNTMIPLLNLSIWCFNVYMPYQFHCYSKHNILILNQFKYCITNINKIHPTRLINDINCCYILFCRFLVY